MAAEEAELVVASGCEWPSAWPLSSASRSGLDELASGGGLGGAGGWAALREVVCGAGVETDGGGSGGGAEGAGGGERGDGGGCCRRGASAAAARSEGWVPKALRDEAARGFMARMGADGGWVRIGCPCDWAGEASSHLSLLAGPSPSARRQNHPPACAQQHREPDDGSQPARPTSGLPQRRQAVASGHDPLRADPAHRLEGCSRRHAPLVADRGCSQRPLGERGPTVTGCSLPSSLPTIGRRHRVPLIDAHLQREEVPSVSACVLARKAGRPADSWPGRQAEEARLAWGGCPSHP